MNVSTWPAALRDKKLDGQPAMPAGLGVADGDEIEEHDGDDLRTECFWRELHTAASLLEGTAGPGRAANVGSALSLLQLLFRARALGEPPKTTSREL